MSITHFTAAPWHVSEHPHADDAEMFDVHWLPDPGDGLCSPLILEGLTLADARLIAAAPDLYTVLDAFLSDYEERGEVGYKLRQRAQAVLDKAVGR